MSRGTSLGPHDMLLLRQWGDVLGSAFGEMPFLVGSTMRGGAFRDVDVRMLTPSKAFVRTEQRRAAINLGLTLWGRQVTGLPIDFQFQSAEEFRRYDGEPRNPLFVTTSERRKDTPMPDTPTPEDVLVLALHAALHSPKAMAAFGAEARAALLGAGYEIVRSEDRRDEQIVREVLSAPLGYSTGAHDDVVIVRASHADGFDCDISTENGEAFSTAEPDRWAALVAACREVSS